MTALNILIQPKFCIVAADSLFASYPDRIPMQFGTKILLLPHLKMVIASTGSGNFFHEWYKCLQFKIIANDIEVLNSYAPGVLKTLFHERADEYGSATVYHIGYCARSDSFIGYQYSSQNGFVSEELPTLTLRPNTEGINDRFSKSFDGIDFNDLPDLFVKIITYQKEIDDRRVEHKVGIGGEVHVGMVTRDFSALRIAHRFSDYDSIWQQCLAELRRRQQQALLTNATYSNETG